MCSRLGVKCKVCRRDCGATAVTVGIITVHHHCDITARVSNLLLCSARGMATRWWAATWAIPFHPLSDWCLCMRCAWRRRHSLFWSCVADAEPSRKSFPAMADIPFFSSDDDNVDFDMDGDDLIFRPRPVLAHNQADAVLGHAPDGAEPAAPPPVVALPAPPPVVVPVVQVARFRRPAATHAATFPWVTGAPIVSRRWCVANATQALSLTTPSESIGPIARPTTLQTFSCPSILEAALVPGALWHSMPSR